MDANALNIFMADLLLDSLHVAGVFAIRPITVYYLEAWSSIFVFHYLLIYVKLSSNTRKHKNMKENNKKIKDVKDTRQK